MRAHGDVETRAKFSSGHHGRYNEPEYIARHAASLSDHYDTVYGVATPHHLSCHNCLNEFQVICRPGLFDPLNHRFCGIGCSKARTWSTEAKDALSAKTRMPDKKCVCIGCGVEFATRKIKKYCSDVCRADTTRASMTAKNRYRKECAFNFNLSDYPDHYDFALVEKHGWYKPKNRGDNLSGVSRDHMVSVSFGWVNGIAPEVISHPANCQLLQHRDNHKKMTACSISVDTLMARIAAWPNKV